MSNRNLWSVVDQIISQTQREVEQLARSIRNSGPFTSDYGFNDGTSSFRASRTPEGLVVKSCRDGSSVTITLTLPLSAASPIKVETLTKDGKSDIKQVSVNDYLKGVEVPVEVKALYEKVKNYVAACLPGFVSRADTQVETTTTQESPNPTQTTSAVSAQTSSVSETPVSAEAETSTTPPVHSTILIPRNGERTLQFEGRSLIRLTTHAVNGRFKEYTVYQTKSGKLVALNAGKSLWPAEVDRNDVKVCLSQEEVLKFFNNEAVSRRICKELGWTDPFVEIID